MLGFIDAVELNKVSQTERDAFGVVAALVDDGINAAPLVLELLQHPLVVVGFASA